MVATNDKIDSIEDYDGDRTYVEKNTPVSHVNMPVQRSVVEVDGIDGLNCDGGGVDGNNARDGDGDELMEEEATSLASNDSSVVIVNRGMTFAIQQSEEEEPYNKFKCITWNVTEVSEESIIGKPIWPNEAVVCFGDREFQNKRIVAKWVKNLSNGSE